MTTSETITKIAPALLKAQKEIGSAKKGSANPFFKSKYADLGEVISVCKDELNNNGIVALQTVGEGKLTTTLLHESGEWISETMNIVTKSENNPQDYGSAITYARRYSLQSMLLIPAEDDDGNRATQLTAPKVAVKPVEQSTENTGTDYSATTNQVWKIEDMATPSQIERICAKYKVQTLKDLTKQQASAVIGILNNTQDIPVEENTAQGEVQMEIGKTPF